MPLRPLVRGEGVQDGYLLLHNPRGGSDVPLRPPAQECNFIKTPPPLLYAYTLSPSLFALFFSSGNLNLFSSATLPPNFVMVLDFREKTNFRPWM